MKMTSNFMLKFATWNCRGLRSEIPHLKSKILQNDLDIIFVQETWLQPFENNIVSDLLSDYDGHSISAMESGKPVCGRPYGGTAILWKKTLGPYISIANNDDPRLPCMVPSCCDEKIVLLNCYLPTADAPLKQSEYFTKIVLLFELSEASKIICAGNFNCDPIKHSSYYELNSICENAGLVISEVRLLPASTVTVMKA